MATTTGNKAVPASAAAIKIEAKAALASKKAHEKPPPAPPMTEEELNMLESPSKESVRWTPEEDEMLRAAVALYKGKNWKKFLIASVQKRPRCSACSTGETS